MNVLQQRYNDLLNMVNHELNTIISERGINTTHTIENGLRVNGEYYVEGRLITHITNNVLVADGLHYQHNCIDLYELIEIVENL